MAKHHHLNGLKTEWCVHACDYMSAVRTVNDAIIFPCMMPPNVKTGEPWHNAYFLRLRLVSKSSFATIIVHDAVESCMAWKI